MTRDPRFTYKLFYPDPKDLGPGPHFGGVYPKPPVLGPKRGSLKVRNLHFMITENLIFGDEKNVIHQKMIFGLKKHK